MKSEHRYIWLDRVSLLLASESDIISIGSESCVLPVLYIGKYWEHLLTLLYRCKRLKIVTPRVGQTEFDNVQRVLEKLSNLDMPIDIVVNDWGIFEYCCHRGGVFRIHIGRQLSRTIIDCPWHGEIIENENELIQKAIITQPYEDNEWIAVLKEMGVRGIELNSINNNFVANSLTKYNMEISIHKEDYLLTCGRTCLGKRVQPTMSCYELCHKKFYIKLISKWNGVLDNNIEADDYERELLKGMAISGKAVTFNQILSSDEFDAYGINVIIESKI